MEVVEGRFKYDPCMFLQIDIMILVFASFYWCINQRMAAGWVGFGFMFRMSEKD